MLMKEQITSKIKSTLNPDINTVGEKPRTVTDITPTNNATIGMRNEWSW